MTRKRTVSLVLIAASLGTTLLGAALMAQKVGTHNETDGRELFAFMTIDDRSFEFASHEVTLVDERDEHGVVWLNVQYGDESLHLRATREPDPPGLPGMSRHMNWMRVLRFAPMRGLNGQELEDAIRAGTVADRLAIVVHNPFQGVNPDELGEVWKRSTSFDFYEFLPNGTFRWQRKDYPESAKALSYRQLRAKRAGEPIPGRSVDDIDPNSWQYQAASIVRAGRDRPTMLPGAMSPDLTFAEDAIGSMGWTLPFTSVSILVLATSIAFAFAPRRVTEDDEQTR
jgi:hypothetical protein